MLKKLFLAAVGLAIAAPVLADNRNRGHRYDYRPHIVHRPVVVQHPNYRPAPRPVHVAHRAPPPVYVDHSPSHAGPALLIGAIVGAAVMHGVLSH